MQSDPFRVLLLFRDELDDVEIIAFAPVGSERGFATPGYDCSGESRLLKVLRALELDRIVRIEKDGSEWHRVFYRSSPDEIVNILKDRFAASRDIQIKILEREPLKEADERALQPLETVTLGSSSITVTDGVQRLRQFSEVENS